MSGPAAERHERTLPRATIGRMKPSGHHVLQVSEIQACVGTLPSSNLTAEEL
jgi:hypothetical protein